MGIHSGPDPLSGPALNRRILQGNAERAAAEGKIRPHEVEKVTSISETLFKGNKGNGDATREAIALVREGKV